MQNQKKDVDRRTNGQTDGVTLSLLELLIAAKNHPDKNLDNIDESTKAFQSIQEAYRIVSFFLADYCNHKDVSSGSSHQEEDELLLNMLASKNRLKFNKDSVTFV